MTWWYLPHTTKRAKDFIKRLLLQFDTKLVNDGSTDSNGLAKYDILGLEVEYMRGEYLKFGVDNSLSDKLPQLGVPLSNNFRFNRAPGQPGMFISRDDIDMVKDGYAKDVLWMQKTMGLAFYTKVQA